MKVKDSKKLAIHSKIGVFQGGILGVSSENLRFEKDRDFRAKIAKFTIFKSFNHKTLDKNSLKFTQKLTKIYKKVKKPDFTATALENQLKFSKNREKSEKIAKNDRNYSKKMAKNH